MFLRKIQFCEKWHFFAKNGQISLELANLQFLHFYKDAFHGPYYFSDFQHHWHDFSEAMTQKVQNQLNLEPSIILQHGVETAMKSTFV